MEAVIKTASLQHDNLLYEAAELMKSLEETRSREPSNNQTIQELESQVQSLSERLRAAKSRIQALSEGSVVNDQHNAVLERDKERVTTPQFNEVRMQEKRSLERAPMTYRSALEVLKFVEVPDILAHSSVVCSIWAKASAASELWTTHLSYLSSTWLEVYQAAGNAQEAYRHLHTMHFFLPFIHHDSLSLFDCRSRTWRTKRRLARRVHAGKCGATYLPNGSVFVCGGSKHETLTITSTGEVTSLAVIPTETLGPGVAYFQGQVFVFGGFWTQNLTCCFKYALELDTWQCLPSMREGRSGINPLQHGSFFVICGGRRSSRIELFHIQTETFSQLDIVLPVSDSGSCTVEYRGKVLILQQDWVTTCHFDGANIVKDDVRAFSSAVSKLQHVYCSCRGSRYSFRGWWGNSGPLVVGSNCYMERMFKLENGGLDIVEVDLITLATHRCPFISD